MKILLLGAAGQLGRCVQDALHDGRYELVALTRADLDLSDQRKLHQAFAQHRPAVVINAAAYNAVDRAESDPDNAYRVNAQGPADLAERCLSTDTYLIHFSTDYVFDGKPQTGQAPLTGHAPVGALTGALTGPAPYPEQAFTYPLSVYGASKLAGDQAVLASGCRAALIRTSWLFSEYGSNFVKTMLRLANEGQSIRVVTDQLGCPTYAGDLAQVVKQLLDWDDQGVRRGPTGLFHYGGDSVVSWYGFAQQIISRAEAVGLLQHPTRLVPICASDFNSPAQRPDFSALDSRLLTQQLGLAASDWQRALDLVLVRLQSARLLAP
ncbi:dTDP-4-dehydrorhamnose reductase [Reinekea sp.]|uniref:dTDP-4-dehydrorhamnose reductase n=1 Tax=Reinekea sp. TaxID=1970455 RepID=UPI002A815A56|nr:dTDP-4-dehydrorhamnose reductase [Reinekea sp.]